MSRSFIPRQFQKYFKTPACLFKNCFMISSVNYDFILLVDIYFQCHLFPKTTHQPEIEDLTHSWLLNVHYIKVALELLKGSINPVLFGTHYLKLIQFNSNITSKTTWRITSSQVNLVLLSLALLYLSLVLYTLLWFWNWNDISE